MKIPAWIDITEEELRSKTAKELYDIFRQGLINSPWDIFCKQEDVTFDLIKDLTIWGTFGPEDNKHPLKWVKLIDCDTDHLLAIRKQRNREDDYDGIIVAILYDRGEINTCDNCDFLCFKMKFVVVDIDNKCWNTIEFFNPF